MYLIDTNVISEARKGSQADAGVRVFFEEVVRSKAGAFLSVVTIGELRRGIERIRHRGDASQVRRLERWLLSILDDYADYVLDVDADITQVWGRLRTPHPENALDKLIAATALVHDLTVVTRNEKDFSIPGLRVINPFNAASS